MASYTPDEYKDLLTRFGRGFGEAVARAQLLAAQQVKADISGRIHSTGGTKDISGSTRQYKSAQYKKKRQEKGRQISVVDHTFTGDLRRSYKLFETRRGVEMRIQGDLNVNKARGNEDLYSAGVWEASDSEEVKAKKAFNREINKYIQKFFD